MLNLPKALALSLFWMAAETCVAADWPWFLGPEQNNQSRETGINTDWAAKPPPVLWTADLGDEGYAGPSVAGGVIYILDHEDDEDVVKAFNLDTGDLTWTFRYEARGKDNYGFARATPSVQDGRVFTMSRDGVVHALDAATGRKLWRRDIIKDVKGVAPKWKVSSSPVLDGERVIVTAGGKNAHLVALDRKTGRTVWEGGGSAASGYATPVIATLDGERQYLVFDAEGVGGVRTRDGALLWHSPWETKYDVNAASVVPLGNDRVFISSGYSRGCSVLEVKNGKARTVWENKEMNAHWSTPVLVGGYLYGTGDPGFLMCLDPRDGATTWKEKGFEKGGVLGIDGHLIAADGKQGDIVLVECTPEAYREKGRIKPLGGQTWVAPIVADGRMVVRNREKLAVIDLR